MKEKLPSFLITGTDTGVGKTHIGMRIARMLREQDQSVGVFKPVESGWPEGGAGSDAELLASAAGSGQALDDVCIYRLKAPIAPMLAAEMEGVRVDVERIVGHLRILTGRFDIVLVEGAGGLLAPLAPNWNILDLAVRCALPALVVVADRLGCVNHSLLTNLALERAGVRRLGFFLNRLPGDADASQDSNAALIASLTGLPVYDKNDDGFIDGLLARLGTRS